MNFSILETLKARITELVQAQYGTQEKLCIELGLSRSVISNLMNDKSDFQLSTLIKISRALGYEIHLKRIE